MTPRGCYPDALGSALAEGDQVAAGVADATGEGLGTVRHIVPWPVAVNCRVTAWVDLASDLEI